MRECMHVSALADMVSQTAVMQRCKHEHAGVQATIGQKLNRQLLTGISSSSSSSTASLIAMLYAPGGPNQARVIDVMALAGSAPPIQYVQRRVVKSSTQLY
jgi:hypothetical protein